MRKITEEIKNSNPAGKLYQLLFDCELAYPREERTIEVVNRSCQDLLLGPGSDQASSEGSVRAFANLQLINRLIQQTESSISEISDELSETNKKGFEKIKYCFHITNLEANWNQYTFNFERNTAKIDDHAKIALENYANLISLKEEKRAQILASLQDELIEIKREIETSEELSVELKEVILCTLDSVETITKTYYQGRKEVGERLFAHLGRLNTLKWLYPSDPWLRKVCSKVLKLCITNALPFVHGSEQEISTQSIKDSCRDQFEAFLQKDFEAKEEFREEFKEFDQVLREPDLFPLFMISRTRRLEQTREKNMQENSTS